MLRSCTAANDLHCMFLGYPGLEYDGEDRTTQLTDKTFNKTVFADGEQSVVFFHDVEADDDEFDQYECFLQLSAQIMAERNYDFYFVNTTKEIKLRKQEDVEKGEDTVQVYQKGYQIEYHGVRDPGTFISWLMDVPDDPVTIINDDDDLDEFEDMADSTVRVVGYFDPGSEAMEEFEEAAEEYMGEIEFFAVVHNNWARRVGLRRVGDVVMYRPFEDDPIYAPTDADSEDEFEDWVDEHKEALMEKLTMLNYFDVWQDADEDDDLIVAFVDEETDEGEAMFELLKELVENNEEHAGNVKIILVDPDEHPLMLDIWEDMFGIDIENGPQIGLVDISEGDGLWFDMDQLNLNQPEKYADENEEVLQAWFEQIVDGTIELDDDDKKAPPKKEPEPVKKTAAGGRRKKEL